MQPMKMNYICSSVDCKKKPVNVMLRTLFAERQGLEPWRQLPVDRLAICSITTLAPLLLTSKSRLILKIASANVVLQLDFRKVILINFCFFYSGYSTRKW